jgi:hypothetical protein
MSRQFKIALVDVNVIGNTADIRFIGVHHHSNSHMDMLRHGEGNVKRKLNTARDKIQYQENHDRKIDST